MKKNFLKSVAALFLIVSFAQKSHAVDLIVAPFNLIGRTNVDLGGVTQGTIYLIGNSANVVGVIIGVLLIPFSILNEQGEVLKPGLTAENLLAQGYTAEEIQQFAMDQKSIFSILGGKRVTVEQYKKTVMRLNLAESTMQILGM